MLPPRLISDAIRAMTAGTAIFVAGFFTTAQGAPVTPVSGSEQIVETAIRQGGLLLVLIVVLFFYRRDYVKLTDFWQQQTEMWRKQTEMLVELVRGATQALTDDAAATREMVIVMHQAKTVMATHLPKRRDEDEDDPRRRH